MNEVAGSFDKIRTDEFANETINRITATFNTEVVDKFIKGLKFSSLSTGAVLSTYVCTAVPAAIGSAAGPLGTIVGAGAGFTFANIVLGLEPLEFGSSESSKIKSKITSIFNSKTVNRFVAGAEMLTKSALVTAFELACIVTGGAAGSPAGLPGIVAGAGAGFVIANVALGHKAPKWASDPSP